MRKEERKGEEVEGGRGEAGLHRNRRNRPSAVAALRARIRAAWGLSGGESRGQRERREWALSRTSWEGEGGGLKPGLSGM